VRRARFKVSGRFDGAPSATVTIVHAGDTGIVEVRPYRRRRAYTLTLEAVAFEVICKVVRAELREKRASRRAARRGGAK
jgi:hypothetical protein